MVGIFGLLIIAAVVTIIVVIAIALSFQGSNDK